LTNAGTEKTDRNDARALAQIMRTGWFRQVHVKSRQCRLWRSLLAARRTVLNEMRAIENVVRAILREAGLKLGTRGRPTFAVRVRELTQGDPCVMQLVDPLLAVLATMLTSLAGLTKQVLDLVRKEEVCRRLMSVPGVGPITALAFRATIDRPDRFRRSRDVGAHLGLTPARYQSGETDIQGRITVAATNSRAQRSMRRLIRAGAQQKVVEPEGLGDQDRQASRHGPRPRRGRSQARRDPPPHVERWRSVPMGQGSREWRHGRSMTPSRRSRRAKHHA
jgi:transposase